MSELACVLCGIDRAVSREPLIAGVNGQVCLPCARACMAQLDGGPIGERTRENLFALLVELLDQLPPTAPFVDSEPLLDAALALAGRDPVRLRRVRSKASQLEHPRRALEAIARLPSLEAQDLLARAAIWCDLGDHARALAEHQAIDPESLANDGERFLHHGNRALYLALTGSARRAGDDLAEAERLLAAFDEKSRVRPRRLLTQVHAIAALESGRLDEALRLAESLAPPGEHPIAFDLRLLGDVHRRRGDETAALAAYRRALAAAHPESADFRIARTRLDGAPPPA